MKLWIIQCLCKILCTFACGLIIVSLSYTGAYAFPGGFGTQITPSITTSSPYIFATNGTSASASESTDGGNLSATGSFDITTPSNPGDFSVTYTLNYNPIGTLYSNQLYTSYMNIYDYVTDDITGVTLTSIGVDDSFYQGDTWKSTEENIDWNTDLSIPIQTPGYYNFVESWTGPLTPGYTTGQFGGYFSLTYNFSYDGSLTPTIHIDLPNAAGTDSVPEPCTILLVGLGLAGLAAFRMRSRMA